MNKKNVQTWRHGRQAWTFLFVFEDANGLSEIFDAEDDGRFGAFVQNGDFREGGFEGGVLRFVRQNDHGDGTAGIFLLRDGGDGNLVMSQDAGDFGEYARLVHDL